MNQPSPAAQGPIWLVGMMGAGKSTVARLLAARTGRRFFDLDRLLEEATGRTVTELFAAEGEAAFRGEADHVAFALGPHREVVVDHGGLAVEQEPQPGFCFE